MSSLADQILERKNRLEALKQKASKTGGVVGSSTVNSFDCDVQPSLKKIKKDVQELRPEDKDIPDENALAPPINEALASGRDNQPDDTGDDSDEIDAPRNSTSDLKELLRPGLEELEKRNQEVIKRLVRQRLLSSTQAE